MKARAAPKAGVGAAVAATRLCLMLLALTPAAANAKVLPEDRGDLLWHTYEGGGVTIEGPSILVRKSYQDKLSIWGNYYADMISGASIDVEATASRYTEEREEFSVGIDYLHGKTIMGVAFTRSDESDYLAETIRFSISQDFFGDLTTVTMGLGLGDDTIMRNGDAAFEESATHQSLRVELSQILTRNLIMNLGVETIADEGYLNNPYRSVRFVDEDAASGFSYQPERYPRTRTSDAFALRAMYYLPWRAALRGEYRFYRDSWGIEGHTVEVSATQPMGDRWEIDLSLRHYAQEAADFYADLFPYRDAANFLARDKELSTFSNMSVGVGVGYTFSKDGFWIFERGTLNGQVDYLAFDYNDFTDVTAGAPPGEEPGYRLNAVVARVYVSLWF